MATTVGALTELGRRDPVAAARAWLDIGTSADPDGTVGALVDAGDEDALRGLFAGRIAFGTAGLRAEEGPGPRRMNVDVVAQTTAGVLAWWAASRATSGSTPRVVIGRDARHGSAAFADAAAAVALAAGAEVVRLAGPVPTPLVAWAVLALGADLGIQVTASHNPPADNGYKLYLDDGAQLAPPHDAAIAAAIDATPLAPPRAPIDGLGEVDVLDRYCADVVGTLPASLLAHAPAARELRIVATAMHGVGAAPLARLFTTAGLPTPTQVPEQAAPDPTFPTVSFPNPEEPGALDLATSLAVSSGADLVFANDPDADRLAVGVVDADQVRVLTGDEVGALLGDAMIRHHPAGDPPRLVANSVVSGSLLGAVAAAAGVEHRVTLTGFKWIVRPGLEEPVRQVFGYEEALGHAVCPDLVRDKDGLSAALVFALLAGEVGGTGRAILDRLRHLERQHGVHRTAQVSRRWDGPDANAARARVMARFRSTPPEAVAGCRRSSQRDLAIDPLPGTIASDAVMLTFAETDGEASLRVIVRPSGTEPKVKCYLEVRTTGDDADATAADLLDRARHELTVCLDEA